MFTLLLGKRAATKGCPPNSMAQNMKALQKPWDPALFTKCDSCEAEIPVYSCESTQTQDVLSKERQAQFQFHVPFSFRFDCPLHMKSTPTYACALAGAAIAVGPCLKLRFLACCCRCKEVVEQPVFCELEQKDRVQVEIHKINRVVSALQRWSCVGSPAFLYLFVDVACVG